MALKHIHNKRKQRIQIALLDVNGKPVGRNLKPNEKTEPIPEDQIGPYTHKLAALGHVKIRNVVS